MPKDATPLVVLPPVGSTPPQRITRELADLNWMEIRELVPGKITFLLLPADTQRAHGVINNGADSAAPLAPARAMAGKLNALVAPVVPYGVTGSPDAYAGGRPGSATRCHRACRRSWFYAARRAGTRGHAHEPVTILLQEGPRRSWVRDATDCRH